MYDRNGAYSGDELGNWENELVNCREKRPFGYTNIYQKVTYTRTASIRCGCFRMHKNTTHWYLELVLSLKSLP